MSSISDKIIKFETRGMSGQLPVVWSSASGTNVISENGEKLLDFTSGIFVTNVGHANENVISGLVDLIDTKNPLLYSYNYHHKYRAEYLDKLISFSQPYFEKAHLMSSGTESTEAALRLIFLNAAKKCSQRNKILTISGNYHGRTLGSAMMSGDAFYTSVFPEISERFIRLPFPDPAEINEKNGEEFFVDCITKLEDGRPEKFKSELAGAMLETFQGWACYFYPKSYVQALYEYVKSAGGLVCFDEMQAGFCRTGKKFGFEYYEVSPDIACVGKGMGSGVPLSGVLSTSEILDNPNPGTLSSTNSANPLACIAGLKTLEEIEKRNILLSSKNLGLIFQRKLIEIKDRSNSLKAVHGRGMIAALHFSISENKEKNVSYIDKLVFDMLGLGLLVVRTGTTSIKLGPPLTIDKNELLRGVEIISKVIRQNEQSINF